VYIESATPGALDMATWDPEARELGVPLSLLFGDLSRSRVKLYAGGWWRGRFDTSRFC
jgi:L-alanine-DL-glutamate epimerase-like enolase superfamily enzyme